MWSNDDDDFHRDSGGFDTSGYGESPAGISTENRISKRPSSVFPVAIKQILESSEDIIQIVGYPVSMMTIVCIITSVDVTSTKIVYTVKDWSGFITGMLWLEEENNDDQKTQNVVENTYCRMTGTKRMHEGRPCLFVYSIVPIEDLSELAYHYLQVVHIPLKAEELRQINQDRMDTSYVNPQSNLNVNYANSDSLSLPPHQMKVYRIVQQCKSESGMNKEDVRNALRGQMPLIEIEKVLEFLVAEGHAYCTIDDDHFKVTDT